MHALTGSQLCMQPVDNTGDLFACNQPGALKLPFSPLMTRTPEEIVVVKIFVQAVPAAAAAVTAEHAPWGVKFGVRQAEAADKHHRYV